MGDASPVVTYDFVQTFPFFTWVSSWSEDEQYPEGFRYKVFATRGADGQAEMLAVLEHGDGLKREMKRLAGDPSAILRASRTLVRGLIEAHGVEFDEFDLSSVTSYEAFEAKAVEFGWTTPNEEEAG